MLERLLLCFLWTCLFRQRHSALGLDEYKPPEEPRGNFRLAEENDVTILTRDTWSHFLRLHPFVLVQFYSPWCTSCDQILPAFEAAARALKETNVSLAKLDVSKDVPLAKELLIVDVPSFLLFKDGMKVETYEGERTAEGFLNFAREKSDPSWTAPMSDVQALTKANFSKVLGRARLALVWFYSTSCRHCQLMRPEYESAAKALSKTGEAVLYMVDGEQERELADEYRIRGWPTLLLFRYGKQYSYEGRRDAKGIIDYMTEEVKLPSKEVRNLPELRNALSKSDVTVVGVFEQGSDLYAEFVQAAYYLKRHFPIVHTFDPKARAFFNVTKDSVVIHFPEILCSEYEEPLHVFDKKSGTYKEIESFVTDEGNPLVGFRTAQNAAARYGKRPLLAVYFDLSFDGTFLGETQLIRRKVLEVAKDYKGSLTFAVSSEEDFEAELRSLGLDESSQDVNVALFLPNDLKYVMPPREHFNSEALREFLTNVSTGALNPYFRSQPVPAKQNHPVITVVANNFLQEVISTPKDVFIMFYAPSCGYCKELMPLFLELAGRMSSDNPNLVFARMDASANDLPIQLPIQGYPALFFFPFSDKSSPSVYNGTRTVEDMQSFVHKHSTLFLTDEEKLGIPERFASAFGGSDQPLEQERREEQQQRRREEKEEIPDQSQQVKDEL